MKQNSRDFKLKVFFSTQNFKSENFVHIKWSEEKFLKGSVGRQMKQYFWNNVYVNYFVYAAKKLQTRAN